MNGDENDWWSQLRQRGMLLSPTVLGEFLPNGPEGISEHKYSKLRDAYTKFQAWDEGDRSDRSQLKLWIDAVLEGLLDYDRRWWSKGNNVPDIYKTVSPAGERLRPERVLRWEGRDDRARMIVRMDVDSPRVGIGRGRAQYSKMLQLMRGTDVPIGLITNGRQFRLAFAGMDYDCWVEWEADRWFEDAEGHQQLLGLVSMCGHHATDPRDGVDYPLHRAIIDSRTRQGELSQVLGEQTRKAVERLLSSLNDSMRANEGLYETLAIGPDGGRLTDDEMLDALYQGTIRLVMRLVVTFFAEARDLLPRDSEVYHSSYGIEGLFSQLNEARSMEGEGQMAESHQAWPRTLGLFRLIHEGCAHQDLSILAYGGTLFRRGDPESADPILRTLALYEDERVEIDDLCVHDVLRLLKVGRTKAKVGRSTRTVSGTVDFSDLRSEYIGMMYEGLLDYRLRRVSEDEGAVVFLNIGDQPVLPFSRLEAMTEKEVKNLFDKLGKSTSDDGDVEEDDEEVTIDEAVEEQDTKARVHTWAMGALEMSGRVKRPKGKKANAYRHDVALREAADALVSRVLLPGEMYLVRGGGNRKGTGTFYTKPQLAVPTVHRTLEPLVYDVEGEGRKRKLTPKAPEDILALKVCDPAMGSGSFLVAVLRYITDGLYESLQTHRMIREGHDQVAITLPLGEGSTGGLHEDLIPCSENGENAEARIKSRLARYVVERCVYGVDLNPLAVELAKLSLWVETMDRELPFEFIDHKMKCGNSLVGCWFDNFQEYPVMAWLREGGDKDHKNGVHFEKGVWTNRIKSTLKEVVKPELIAFIRGQSTLSDFSAMGDRDAHTRYEGVAGLFDELHAIPLFGDKFQDRESLYRDIRDDERYLSLRRAFDLWCSIWFWPAEWLDEDAPTPNMFYSPSDVLMDRVSEIAKRQRFFHWELEFPDVFITPKAGFDAVIGNPPWEISKPNSKEFFSSYDPLYNTYGKQDAIGVQRALFDNERTIENDWLDTLQGFKAMGNWQRHVGSPFGDPDALGDTFSLGRRNNNIELHSQWRKRRSEHNGFADRRHPFIHQGSADINTYKMFTETAHALCPLGGRMGMIVPSGIYTDNGTRELRELLVDGTSWEWLFSFENRKKIFDIDSRFKFCALVAEKGGTTDSINVAFMQHDLESWESPWGRVIGYSKEQLERFSPNSKAILEIGSERDLAILEKIFSNSVLLGDEGPDSWNVKYSREFDMTNDSHLFPPRTWWEEKGYRPDDYGRWVPPEGEKPELIYKGKRIGPDGDIALPLYEGRMIGQFDFSQKGWVSGKGRTAVWRDIPWDDKKIEPQYLMAKNTFESSGKAKFIKIALMDVTSSTNSRTVISTILTHSPCNHKVPILSVSTKSMDNLYLCSILNSFVYDYSMRMKLGGQSLIWAVLKESNIPISTHQKIIEFTKKLSICNNNFSLLWIYDSIINKRVIYRWALTNHERIRLRSVIDSIIGHSYSLSIDDFQWILRIDPSNPKGFWRVDKDKPIELRQTTLALAAFRDLKKLGLERFCELNDGEGWMIPEHLSFEVDDDGVIHFDTPNSTTYEVRSKLGDRFLPWQLEGTPEESWKECEMHARNILGEEGFERFMKALDEGRDPFAEEEEVSNKQRQMDLSSFEGGSDQ